MTSPTGPGPTGGNTVDPYLDPASGVLRNKLGITDPEQLRQAEADVALIRNLEINLGIIRIEGRYNLTHLQQVHQHLFSDIYPWAGQIRTAAIAKHDVFCLPQFIEEYAAKVFSDLAGDDWLRGTDQSTFVSGLAHYYSEINAVHPFREGNGRAQRAFLGQLAADAGFHIAWSRLDPADNIAISVAGFHGDKEVVAAVLGPLVSVDHGLEPWVRDLLVGHAAPAQSPRAAAARAKSTTTPVAQPSPRTQPEPSRPPAPDKAARRRPR
ncbi:Fic family protein [Sphaerisporangium viridialbum]|uniref:Fic family protein n=1 Tax=Sphaerisporangium viridialbum TaxID=46189 RepID=UPI003C73B810